MVFLPPQDLQSIESGKLLLKSLGRGATGIPSSILNNINSILRSQGALDKRELGSRIAEVGGATGTSGSSQALLRDLQSRGEGGINLSVGRGIGENLLRDVSLREQQEQAIGGLRLGGASLEGQLGQGRSAAERDLFSRQEGVRLANRADEQARINRNIGIGTSLLTGGLGGIAGFAGAIPGLTGGIGGALVGGSQGLTGSSLGGFQKTSLFGPLPGVTPGGQGGGDSFDIPGLGKVNKRDLIDTLTALAGGQ